MKKILIAEDEEEVRELFKRILSSKYEVIEARDGREAVEKYKNHNPDLALIDIKMPVLKGDKAIREIRSLDPGANIVAVTAYDFSAENLGVEVLRKGFGMKQLLDVVDKKLRLGGQG